jgi:hypothetical protein
MSEYVRVGHTDYGLAHLDEAAEIDRWGSTYTALCGVEFDPGPAYQVLAQGKPLCGFCQEIAANESARQS